MKIAAFGLLAACLHTAAMAQPAGSAVIVKQDAAPVIPGAFQPGAAYSLAQAISASIAHSTDLQNAQRNIEIDRKRADEAAAKSKPRVSADAQATRYDQATSISLGGTPPIEVLPAHTEQLSINLADRLDITGQTRAAYNQAKLHSEADQYQYSYLQNQLVLQSTTTYYNLLRAQHEVQVAQSALDTAERQLTDAQNLNAAQVGQKIDVFRAATQQANAEQQLTAAENSAAIARANFNDLIGRPLTDSAQVIDVPGVNVGVDISKDTTVGAPSKIFATPFVVAPSEISAIDIDQSLKTAYAQRPEILMDQVNVREAESDIKLARAGLEPTLDINASGNYYPTTSFQTPRKRVALVSANLQIPLYDSGAARDRIQEARLSTQNAQAALESQKEDVALEVRQTYLNLSTAARQIDAANTALQQAIAARQLAQVRYEGQVGTYLEVTDAQAALVQAENNQVDSVYNYLVAGAQFKNSLGTPPTK